MKIVILGAYSGIAEACARLWAGDGHQFCLVGRDSERLEIVKKDITVRGAKNVICLAEDLVAGDKKLFWEKIAQDFGIFDVLLIAYGTLPDQLTLESHPERLREVLTTNFVSVAEHLMWVAPQFEKQRYGSLLVISSVAGDRGRRSNYGYGSAKAGLSSFLQGLRGRLMASGVHVMTIKPGPVDTVMTAHLKKSFLMASPERVALQIDEGFRKKRNIVYAPCFWRWVMMGIKAIPETIFSKYFVK